MVAWAASATARKRLTAPSAWKSPRERSVPPLESMLAQALQAKVAMDAARAEYQDAVEMAADRLDAIPVDQFIIAGIKTST